MSMSGSDTGAAGGSDAVSGADATPAKPRRPRLKQARAAKAIATAEALGTAGAEAMAELDRLRGLVDRLVQGLQAMLETQATHTEMIRQLLAAATVPTNPEHQVARQLDRMVTLLDSQGSQLRSIGATLSKLPAEVGSAVAREVASTLDKVQ